MPKVLTQEQIDSYRTDSYLAPMDGIDPADAATFGGSRRLEAASRISAGQLQMKGHLCFRRSYSFIFNPVFSMSRRLIGEHPICSRFWIRRAGWLPCYLASGFRLFRPRPA